MSGLGSPTLSKLLFFFIATPTGLRRHPAAPHKRTERRLCFWFIAPQQAAGVRAQAGAARRGQRVSTVCAGGAIRPLQGNARSGMSRSPGKVGPWSRGLRMGRSRAAGPVSARPQRSDVERGGRGQRGGSGGRGGRWHRAPSAQHSPLEDAGVLAAQRDEVRVVVREPDAGHVAAVAAVHEARRLGENEDGAAAAPAPGPTRPAAAAQPREASPWRARTGTGTGALCRSRRPRPPRARYGSGTGS